MRSNYITDGSLSDPVDGIVLVTKHDGNDGAFRERAKLVLGVPRTDLRTAHRAPWSVRCT